MSLPAISTRKSCAARGHAPVRIGTFAHIAMFCWGEPGELAPKTFSNVWHVRLAQRICGQKDKPATPLIRRVFRCSTRASQQVLASTNRRALYKHYWL